MVAFEVEVNLMLKIYQSLQCVGVLISPYYICQEAENSIVLDQPNLNALDM